MTEIANNKPKYDLEERTFQFAKSVRLFVKALPQSTANYEDSKQLIRSSGSVGANYIEANESLGKKDFLMKIKISRKESKESHYWLRLISKTNEIKNKSEIDKLIQESTELRKFFHQFLKNLSNRKQIFEISYLKFI